MPTLKLSEYIWYRPNMYNSMANHGLQTIIWLWDQPEVLAAKTNTKA